MLSLGISVIEIHRRERLLHVLALFRLRIKKFASTAHSSRWLIINLLLPEFALRLSILIKWYSWPILSFPDILITWYICYIGIVLAGNWNRISRSLIIIWRFIVYIDFWLTRWCWQLNSSTLKLWVYFLALQFIHIYWLHHCLFGGIVSYRVCHAFWPWNRPLRFTATLGKIERCSNIFIPYILLCIILCYFISFWFFIEIVLTFHLLNFLFVILFWY